MGLPTAALRFLVREHRRKPLGSAVLTLGRQCVYATYQDLLDICRDEGVVPAELPADVPRHTSIPAWHGTPRERYTSDVAVFRTLGAAEVLALDCSAFEGAELVHDLNQPVPGHLASRFDLVFDSGTLEHVFDVRTALMNVGQMVKRGGRVIHLSPCNNFANHGFYQFSPTLLIDYYEANGFAALQAYVAEFSPSERDSVPWQLFRLDLRRQPVVMRSRRRLLVVFVAEKAAGATVDRIPQQTYYRQLLAADPGAAGSLGAMSSRVQTLGWLKRLVPERLKAILRQWLGRDPHQKPWGATRRDTFR